MKRSLFIRLLILALCLSTTCGWAQKAKPFKISEVGSPLMTVLDTELLVGRSTYGIDQAENGLLYFANPNGIIQFDGLNYEVFMTEAPNGLTDVAVGADGRIYGVSRSEHGYLEANEQGKWKYYSLIERTTNLVKDIGSFFFVDRAGDNIVYWSFTDIIIYNTTSDKITVHSSEKFSKGWVVDDNYYLMESGKGLVKLIGDQLKPVPLSTEFINLSIVNLVRFSESELLVVTSEDGLFLYDGQRLTEWETEIESFLKNASPYSAESIKNQYFAIGGRTEGLVIIDKEGKLIQKIDDSKGFPEGAVWELMLDRENNLWATTWSGVVQINLNSPFTIIDSRHGLKGNVNQIKRHKDRVYISTNEGLYFKKDTSPWQSLGENKPFKRIEGHETAYVLESKGDRLLMANTFGVFEVIGDRLKEIHKDESYWAGVGLNNSNDVILGSYQGHLSLVRKNDSGWKFIKKLDGFAHQIDFMEQSDDGDIWITDSEAGVFKLALSKDNQEILSVNSYDTIQGLPSKAGNRVYRGQKGIVFATNKGIYQYDKANDRFVLDEDFSQALGESYITRFAQAEDGSIFISGGRGKGLLFKINGGYEFQRTPFQQITNYNILYPTFLGTNNLWIGSNVIHHFDPTVNFNSVDSFKAYIASIKVLTKDDSLLFGGVGGNYVPELTIKENGLEFVYSGLYYEFPEQVDFQTFMEGFDEDWTDWTLKTSRQFFNLKHGTYNFKLRARNAYGQVGEIDEFSFIILTPWYLTWWAYVLYALAIFLVVRSIVRINVRRLEKEKVALEQTISERTEEIRHQKDEIEKQANKLRELDKVKSRFFSNISHELRTPLTLINAPLESLIHNGKINDPEVRQTLETATRNGVSLLSLVEEILDLAKLDGGKLKLVENPVRVNNFLELLLSDYKSGFAHKSITLTYKFYPKVDMALLIDENRCTKIINNLLSNALKFTPEGGSISVVVDEDIEENLLFIRVTDSGVGIHPDDISHVFDRYYQSDQPDMKAQGGTGIGLALAKELTHLHGGRLMVDSELGQGATFTLTLPIKEVFEETIFIPSVIESEELEIALNEAISSYSKKFEVDKPVLLVTEDHPEMRSFIAKTLAPYFEIRQAENGKIALGILKAERIDIVISDVMMPVMDGFELLEAIKKDKTLHQVSLVMLTARADHDDKLYALTLGIDDYLTKPFSSTEFLARIKNILENRIKIIRKLDVDLEPIDIADLVKKYDLVEREVEVLNLLVKRCSNPEIADALFISVNTVKFHIKNIFGKLGITSRLEALEIVKPFIE